jgi:hypothetical protein
VSLRKYAQVLGQAGDWEWFQGLLRTLDSIAQKHSTSLANIATRYVHVCVCMCVCLCVCVYICVSFRMGVCAWVRYVLHYPLFGSECWC